MTVMVGKIVSVAIGAQVWICCAVDGCDVTTPREGDVLCPVCRHRADKWGEYGDPLSVLEALMHHRDRRGFDPFYRSWMGRKP